MRKRWIGAIGVSALAGMSLVSLVAAFPTGMDVEAMRRVAGSVQSQTQNLRAITVDLQNQAMTAQRGWEGPDATLWIASLNEQVTHLHSMQANLESLAVSLSQNIHANEAAAGGAAAPRPRVRVLMKPPGD